MPRNADLPAAQAPGRGRPGSRRRGADGNGRRRRVCHSDRGSRAGRRPATAGRPRRCGLRGCLGGRRLHARLRRRYPCAADRRDPGPVPSPARGGARWRRRGRLLLRAGPQLARRAPPRCRRLRQRPSARRAGPQLARSAPRARPRLRQRPAARQAGPRPATGRGCRRPSCRRRCFGEVPRPATVAWRVRPRRPELGQTTRCGGPTPRRHRRPQSRIDRSARPGGPPTRRDRAREVGRDRLRGDRGADPTGRLRPSERARRRRPATSSPPPGRRRAAAQAVSRAAGRVILRPAQRQVARTAATTFPAQLPPARPPARRVESGRSDRRSASLLPRAGARRTHGPTPQGHRAAEIR